MGQIVYGVSFLFRGWGYIFRSPKLMLLCVLPLLIDIALVIGLISWGLAFVKEWTLLLVNYFTHLFTGATLGTEMNWSQSFFYYMLIIIIGFGWVALSSYFVFILAMIINSPFYIAMSETVFNRNNWLPERPFSFRRWLGTTLAMLLVSLKKALLFLLIGVVIALLSVIPILNVVAIGIALLMVAYDCSDYSFEVMEWPLSKRLQFFLNNFLVFFGMSIILAIPLLIPGGILLLMPGAVVGAALTSGQLSKGAG